MPHYAKRDLMGLDRDGAFYIRHVSAMTTEGLHAKSDIAAELGWRDQRIARLSEALDLAEYRLRLHARSDTPFIRWADDARDAIKAYGDR